MKLKAFGCDSCVGCYVWLLVWLLVSIGIAMNESSVVDDACAACAAQVCTEN